MLAATETLRTESTEMSEISLGAVNVLRRAPSILQSGSEALQLLEAEGVINSVPKKPLQSTLPIELEGVL